MSDELTAKQQKAIAALIESPTLTEAAERASVSVATLWRWMRVDVFQREYRAARRQVVEQAVAQLQSLTSEAIQALRRNLTCGKPAVEVTAANSILQHAIRGVELIDLEERISEIEQTLPARASSLP